MTILIKGHVSLLNLRVKGPSLPGCIALGVGEWLESGGGGELPGGGS